MLVFQAAISSCSLCFRLAGSKTCHACVARFSTDVTCTQGEWSNDQNVYIYDTGTSLEAADCPLGICLDGRRCGVGRAPYGNDNPL